MKTIKSILTTCSVFACLTPAIGASFLQLSENAQLHLLADFEFVYESNLFLRSANEVSDSYLAFSPGVELRFSEEGAASAVLRYQHRFTAYVENSGLSGDFADLSLQGRYDSGLLLTTGYVRYKESASNTIDASLEESLIERSNTDAGASLRYELSELTAVKGGVDFSSVDYQDARFTDYDSVSVPVTFFYKVRPKVDLTAGLRYRTTDTSTNNAFSFDYDDMYYFVGAVGELFSPVIFADVSIGYQTRDYDGAPIDSSSASYDITFIYTGDVKTTVYAGLSRDYRTSAIGGTAYAFTSASLGARYHVSRAVGVNAGIVVGASEYEESPRAEDMTILNLGASYHPNDYLTLKASYEYTDVDGKNIFSSDYKNNEIRVTASVRY